MTKKRVLFPECLSCSS